MSILRPVLLHHVSFLVESYHPVETLLGCTARSSHGLRTINRWCVCVYTILISNMYDSNISPSQH